MNKTLDNNAVCSMNTYLQHIYAPDYCVTRRLVDLINKPVSKILHIALIAWAALRFDLIVESYDFMQWLHKSVYRHQCFVYTI